MSLSIEVARRILEASKHRANELRSPVSIAIVDAGGHLVLFERMMSPYGWATASISIAKATTAVMFNQSTDSVAQWGSGIPGFASSMATMTQGKFIMAAGGWPIRVGGATVGGIGVSGGNAPGRDDEIARAGLATLAGMAEAEGAINRAPTPIPARPVQDVQQPQRRSSMPLPSMQSQQSSQVQSVSMSGRQNNPVATSHLPPEEDSFYLDETSSLDQPSENRGGQS